MQVQSTTQPVITYPRCTSPGTNLTITVKKWTLKADVHDKHIVDLDGIHCLVLEILYVLTVLEQYSMFNSVGSVDIFHNDWNSAVCITVSRSRRIRQHRTKIW